MEQVDGYCERADIKLGTEPHNALTNLGFLCRRKWPLNCPNAGAS